MRILFALVLLSGCFNPQFKEQLACGTNGECPPGRTCGTDNICHEMNSSPGDGSIIDMPIDAPPIECTSDPECSSPDMCRINGRCDTTLHICVFQPLDCSAMTDECNDGVCQPATGCVKVPAHQDMAC